MQLTLPPNLPNTRFYKDLLAIHRPALTFVGFDNGGDHRHGFGLKQVIERAQNENDLSNHIIRKISETALENIWRRNSGKAQKALHIPNHNANVFQARCFVALLTLILEENKVSIPHVGGLSHVEAMKDLIDVVRAGNEVPLFANEVDTDLDRVKWTRSLMNMARGIDLYLALENAYAFYEKDESSLLLESEKRTLLNQLATAIEEVVKVVDSGLGIGGYISGNWSLKMWIAAAYGCLATQAWETRREKRLKNWFGRGVRRAGPGDVMDKRRYWTYMSSQLVGKNYQDGQRTWAEGPYYLQFALQDVVPFWHAIRAQGYLTNTSHGVDFSDPFHAAWFTAPVEWLADIATPEAGTPPFDDGNRKIMDNIHLMSWSSVYGHEAVGQKMNALYHVLTNAVDGIPQTWKHTAQNVFLVQLAIPQAEEARQPASMIGNRVSGVLSEEQLIIRRTLQGRQHYICLHGEGSNDAIWRGEGHEQPDQLQLLYYIDDQSVIMDAGYDRGHIVKNSSWNRYTDHNVMAYQQTDSGMSVPARLTKKVAHPAVTSLFIDERSGERLAVLKGSVPLTYRAKKRRLSRGYKHETNGLYSRTVLFVVDDETPYLIDINSTKNKVRRGRVPRMQMRYHIDSPVQFSGINGIWQHWRYDKKPDVYMAFETVEFGRDQGEVRIEDADVEEGFRSRDTIKRFTFLGSEQMALTTMAIFQVHSAPPQMMIQPLIAYTDRKPLSYQVWQCTNELEEQVDVILARSPLDAAEAGQAISFVVALPGGNEQEFICPGKQEVGFARLVKASGTWQVDKEYLYGLEPVENRPMA